MSDAERQAIRERAFAATEPVDLISKHGDGTETVFCGEADGEYRGWQERSYADSKGWTYKGLPDQERAALAADVLALDAALDALVAERDRVLGAYHRENDGRLAAEAEVARLREALTEIATPMPENEGDWGENYNWHAVAKRRRDIARAALGEDA